MNSLRTSSMKSVREGGLFCHPEEAADVIVVFRNRRGVDGLMRGKFTLGADAAVAAGPIGRHASAATDVQLQAEILSYSRSRGLFAGVAIDGAAMLVNHRANAAFYAPKPGQPQGSVPVSAMEADAMCRDLKRRDTCL